METKLPHDHAAICWSILCQSGSLMPCILFGVSMGAPGPKQIEKHRDSWTYYRQPYRDDAPAGSSRSQLIAGFLNHITSTVPSVVEGGQCFWQRVVVSTPYCSTRMASHFSRHTACTFRCFTLFQTLYRLNSRILATRWMGEDRHLETLFSYRHTMLIGYTSLEFHPTLELLGCEWLQVPVWLQCFFWIILRQLQMKNASATRCEFAAHAPTNDSCILWLYQAVFYVNSL